MARTWRALGALLSYPTVELQAAADEIFAVLVDEGIVPTPQRQAIGELLAELAATDIYELQEWGSNLFHVGILAIFAGHFVGLLTPIAVFNALGASHTFKQLLAMTFGGVAGIACWTGITLLAHRRLFDARIRNTSSFGDIAILLLLWVQLTLGLLTIPVSAEHLDGSEMVKFMDWAQDILTLHPGTAGLIADVGPIFKCHLFLGMTIFLVFPFTRLVHVWSAPIWYLGRTGYQVVRTRRAVVVRHAATGDD
jgi:nitrate reductase gamma subunit